MIVASHLRKSYEVHFQTCKGKKYVVLTKVSNDGVFRYYVKSAMGGRQC